MTRRVVEWWSKSIDHENLQVVMVFEEGKGKQDIKKEIPFSKSHFVLYCSNGEYQIK
ncbi:hypothetical protein J3D57_001048 [Bacillus amyloliquefaciens]|nr:hypothetical protein [Bacillus amyloliquefaciens]